MRVRKFGVAALFAATGVAAGIMAAPIAGADTCDPAVTVCQGVDVQTRQLLTRLRAPVSTADDQYPYDSDWYFNPAGGGTELQPEHPSTSGGGRPAGAAPSAAEADTASGRNRHRVSTFLPIDIAFPLSVNSLGD